MEHPGTYLTLTQMQPIACKTVKSTHQYINQQTPNNNQNETSCKTTGNNLAGI